MTTPPERPEPSGAGPAPAEPIPEAAPASAPARPPFEERVEALGKRVEANAETFGMQAEASAGAFGKRAEESGEAFGRRVEVLGHEAEAAAQRWSSSPVVKETADAAGRIWGLVLLGVGVWFFADITLGLRMPAVAWRDLWPLALIAFGGYVVLKGMTRRA